MTIDEMKQRKKELGYTNQQLAELSGIPVSTVSKILAGATSSPRYETLQALTRILNKNSEDITSDKYQEDVERLYDTASIGKNSEKQNQYVRESVISYSRNNCCTLEDYLNLPADGPRKELIDGIFYDMAEPSFLHQMIISFLMHKLTDYIFENKGTCITVTSPVAVQLDADDKTVVQPDILVVCDRDKIRSGRLIGAPDLVIEVLSPSTRKIDMGIKAYKYQNAGVREYWLIDSDTEQILVYDYEKDTFPVIYGFEDTIPVRIWDERCTINLKEMKNYISFLKKEQT